MSKKSIWTLVHVAVIFGVGYLISVLIHRHHHTSPQEHLLEAAAYTAAYTAAWFITAWVLRKLTKKKSKS
jgi:hypothetical protein